MIEKLNKFINKNYPTSRLIEIYKDLEDQNIKVMGEKSLEIKYPLIFEEIINMLKNDENIRMIFSISQSFNNNWDIISSNNSAFEYYISTMNQYSREFLKFQWDEYLDEDKQPFIDAVKIIRNNITNKINNIWTTKIQELLYLITPHNNSYQLRTHYILF